jgi:hypothetical protein
MYKCVACHHPKNATVTSSCNHPICFECIHKELFYNINEILKEDETSKKIKLLCIVCDSGFHSLSKQEI